MKKSSSGSCNSRNSAGRRLGMKKKKLEGIPGNIIARQRGTEFHPEINVGMGKDHTIFAKVEGKIDSSLRIVKSSIVYY